jgi:Flp pilus assembly protein TadG
MAACEGFPGRTPIHALGRAKDGVTAIEFALLLPLFVLLLGGIIEFGDALFCQLALQHAVTAAARCATVSASAGSTPDCSTAGNVETFAARQAYGLHLAASVFAATSAPGFNCVTARYPYGFALPLLPSFALTLTARSCYPA